MQERKIIKSYDKIKDLHSELQGFKDVTQVQKVSANKEKIKKMRESMTEDEKQAYFGQDGERRRRRGARDGSKSPRSGARALKNRDGSRSRSRSKSPHPNRQG